MKIIKSASHVKQQAKRHLTKRCYKGTNVEFVRKHLRGPRYMYRFIEPGWGVVFGFKQDGTGYITFDTREWQGGYGWDVDRHRMHVYSNRYPKTNKVYRWQWQWKSYGYDRD